ncbi:MAG: glutathione synthase [Alphaproteobacteria bacterium]
MVLTVAFQMDHISGLDIAGDTTFALMLEGQRRGHALLHYTPGQLSLTGQKVEAAVEPVTVADQVGRHFELATARRMDLSGCDAVFLRQDPPFDMSYISSTHLLDRIHPETLVVNDPAHVRNAPEKLFVMEYPDLMPETVITRDRAMIREFREAHGDIIIKPLYGNGGAAVFRLRDGDENLSALLELFETVFVEPFIVQRYLPAVRAGDKRILLVDGEVAGAINRVPPEGDARSNMHAGGRAEPCDLTDSDLEICARLAPELKRRGFILVGIDVIGDRLTEINVTSPTGIREVARFGGKDVAAMVWDVVEEKRAG